ncbi:acyltransferase family protein [Methylobacterium gregans]|uniref:O-acetyltransferase OatA n=1 Tax=Methylobacterium gregans TaxID=374424 RepID=A0AA37HTP9_9HYPH|nr:acyltransferase [Methylobacterium gregans]MDQ0520469.1 peptidoglycan/LPS O-acetylase OafA/YrhL [Methylobacterium gregans]GJD81814.1 O-acetyltransferase OatA [Methylobacterium gregans]GLS52272.1 acyltransferase [Methylobacterium gregans]
MRLDGIQVLRAAAALMVVLHHLQHELAALGLGADGLARLPGWAGVDVFFVISGFIIVHATGPAYDGPGGRRRFLAHRVARVVPLYWLVTLAYLAVALVLPRSLGDAGAAAGDPAYLAASFLFWPAARPDGSLQPLYGLGWTLNYEMLFYAVFALCLGRGRRATVAWTGAALAGLVLFGRLAAPESAPLRFWSDPIVLEFLFGAAIGLVRAAGFRLGAPVRAALALGGIAGLALIGSAEVAGLGRPLLAGLPAACLVAALALGKPSPRSSPLWVVPLSRLGDASYALYLVHPFCLRGVREGLVRSGLAGPLGNWGVGTLMLTASVAAAVLTYRLIERPATRALRARLDPGGGRADRLPNLVRGRAASVPREAEPN